jgi:hypothetical protein
MTTLQVFNQDMEDWFNSGWTLSAVDSVATMYCSRSVVQVSANEVDNSGTLGPFELGGNPRRYISGSTHQRLLERSLQEHKDIWDALAAR